MSNNRKNNHYHYAEKYAEKRNHSRSGRSVYVPFKAVIASLVVLLMFGLVSTTFGAYITESEPEYNPEKPGIISEVRNIKASRDVALTGANVDLAATAYNFSNVSFVFDNTKTNWSSSYVFQLMIGHGTYSNCYTLTHITGTNLYGYYNLSFSGATQICIIANSSAWGDENNPVSSRYTYATKRTNYITLGGNYSGFFQAYGASSSNGCALTFDYTDDNYDYFNYDQTIRSDTSNDGSTYTQVNDGGTISGSGKKLTGSTQSGDSSESDGKVVCAKTSSVTLTATASSGYKFVGWYDSSNTIITTGTSGTDGEVLTYTVTGDREIHARFVKQVTVSTAKNPTSYNQTLTPNSTGTTVDAGSEVTLNANVKTGVTFGGWTFSGTKTFKSGYSASSNPCVIIPTTDVTATAKYTLDIPTNLSLSYPTIVVGNTSTPTKSATSPSSGSLSYSFSIEPSSGTTAASGTYSVDSDGVVTASTPGKYTVTMSVTTTKYGLTSSAATNTAEVTVKPLAPTDITIEANNATSGSGTFAEPYKIPVNKTRFNIKSYIPVADRNANYTYNWTRTDGTYVLSNGTITNGTSSKTTNNNTEITDTASATTTDVIHNYQCEATKGYIYKIAVYSQQNGVQSDPLYKTIYYGVTADFLVVENFDFSDFNSTEGQEVQKIYDENNNINHINASYDVGGTNFDTMLFFSNNNITFNKVAVWTDRGSFTLTGSGIFNGTHSALPNDTDHRTHNLINLISTFARNNVNLMSFTGPKWFRGYIDDYNNGNIAAQTPDIHNSLNTITHTTVGTSSTVSNRPVYYVDTTGITHVNSRVMAFFLLDSDETPVVHYQTGQKVGDRANTYRFYIPSDATKITFAHVADNNYVLPTLNNGNLSYAVYTDSTVLMAWTPTIDLTNSANVGKNAYEANTPGSPDSNGIYHYSSTVNSGNMTVYSYTPSP